MWLLCPKMRARIWGCLGQMAHRRQIAQWVGTRTTHPGGTGFEPRRGLQAPRGLMMGISPEDCRGRLDPFPRYLILRVKRRFSLERLGSRPVLAQNQGVSPRASRRGFFRPQKHAPGFFCGQKSPFLAPGTRRPLPGGAHIKSDPTMYFGYLYESKRHAK